MDETKSATSHEFGKNIKLWDKTTKSIQIKEKSPSKLPPLRVSPSNLQNNRQKINLKKLLIT